MLKKLDNFLNILMGSSVGVFLGHGLYLWWDHKTRPGLYALRSAPWYTSILVYGGVTAVILAAAFCIKIWIRSRSK